MENILTKDKYILFDDEGLVITNKKNCNSRRR